LTGNQTITGSWRVLSTGDGTINGEWYMVGDPTSLLSTNTGYGEAVTFPSAVGVTFSRVYYWNGTAWTATDANAASSSKGLLSIALSTSTSNGMLLRGYIYNSAWNWTSGATLYLNTTAGTMTETQPSGTADIVRVVGYAINSRLIYFNPSQEWIELV